MKNKKLFAILTLVCFMFTLMPVAAFAGETVDPYAGYAVVEVATQEELVAAINAVAEPTVIELSAGTYTFYNNGSYGEKQLVFKGAETGVIIDGTALGNEVYGDELTFENVTFKFPETSHKGLTHTTNKVVFNNCTLTGTQTLYAPTVEFNNCTFDGNQGKDMYYVWTYDAKNVTFTDCTFNTGGKAILVYHEDEKHADITLKNCTFNDDDSLNVVKAAVEVGSSNNSADTTYNITFENCTVNGFAVNNEGTSTGSTLWGNKNSMDADHLKVVIVETAVTEDVCEIGDNKYATLAEAVDAAETGDTVTLLADTKLSETVTIAADKNITLDLNGKAITVTKSGDRSLYAFDNKGTLTLMDSVGTGSITARGNYNYGTMIMNGGTIIACDTNGGYGVWNYGDFTLNDGTVKVTHVGNSNDDYGPTGLGNMADATMTITGGNIEGASARAYALSSEGTLNITPAEGKEITLTAPRGVAIDAGTAVINGGTFTVTDARDAAAETYYALYISGGDAVIVNGGTFTAPDQSVWNKSTGTLLTINGGYFNTSMVGKDAGHANKYITIYGGTFAVDPTASGFVADGYEVVADGSNYKVVVAHKHNYITTVVDATCTTDGYTLVFCACGDETKTVTPALGHNYSEVTVSATCTAQGYTTHTCGKCGGSYVDNYVPATGHNWGEGKVTTPATTITKGVKTYTCSVCKATKSETIPMLSHNFDSGKPVAPTCTSQGYTEYTCQTCKKEGVPHTYRDKWTGATGHNYKTPETISPTCRAKGYTKHTCATCGYTFTDTITAITDHTWVLDSNATKAPSGNVEGSKTYNCSVCGAKKTETIPATGCSFTAKVEAPKCTEQGYTIFTCTECTGDKKGHNYTGNYIPATGHTLQSVVKAPTCTAKGYTTHTCQVSGCGYKMTNAVTDMLPHNYVYNSTVKATADVDGKIIYKCSCGEEKTEVIPATGHHFTAKVTKAAGCENDGVITYTCGDCANHSYTETIPVTGHKWVKGALVPASCTTSGYIPNTCTNGCGATRNTDLVAMKNHTFGENNKCTESGCDAVNAAAMTEVEKNNLKGTAATLAENTKVANTLSYKDAGEVQKAMEEVVDGNTSALYDISLKMDGAALTANNFPAEGYEFNIDLPANADANTVVVSHMITETYGGHLAGDIEILPSQVRDGKVYFRTYSTSPVLVSYETTSTSTSSNSGGGFSGSYNYPVSAPKVDNGSVTLSDNNAVAGETVTATVKPDNGYGVAEVIVTDEKGNVIPVTYLGNGEYSFVMPAGKVNIETVCKPAITLTVGNTNANVFGKNVKNDVAPIITPEGRTMLPIRFITEALGGNVEWSEATQTVTITKDGVKVQIIIGADYAYINGEKVKLDSAAFIENGRTYLPVRFVSEALGATVNWDGKTQQVVIMK